MEMFVNTVRKVDYDQVKEYTFGDNDSLKNRLAIGLINPEDFKNLNLSPNLNLKLSNSSGTVIIKPMEDKNVPLGTILMPVSIWANRITGIDKKELLYKNLKVNVETTKDSVLGIKDLLKTNE
ncbi:MAG: molybdopterin dinucleotide binding domain-containing protein [Candidatus Hodarchaeota archaeon]